MSLTEGQVIGNYRILSRLGVGGMGAVYLAEHPLIGKRVALKVIHKELSGNREVVGRFFNEARAVNKIGNEHIVEVHDLGQSPDGHYFFIMELLEGQTLAQLLSRERVLPIQRVQHIAAQISDALGAAHACGIIHRDLKPDNVMLVSRMGDPDFVKILDFGLAKMFMDGMLSNLTAQGVVLGTPQYMSPEACESKKTVDHRTDIYALGILMFQMLCGQLPFDGDSMGAVLVKQVTQAPPAPRALNPTIPPSVEQIILRCLAKEPDARFATMLKLREALLDPDRYLASSPPVVQAAVTRSSAAARTLYDDAAGPVVPMQPINADAIARAATAPPGMGYMATAALPVAPAPGAGGAGGGGRATGPAMALPAPPPSMISSVPQPSQAQTLFMDQGPAPASAAPAYGGGSPAAAAATMFDPAAVAPVGGAAPVMPPRRSTVVPAQPANHTMVIATPPGYSTRPPRKGLGVALVVLLLAAAAGGGVALALLLRDRGGDPAPGASEPAPAGTAAEPGAKPEDVEPAPAPAPGAATPDAGAAAAAGVDAGPAPAPALAPDAGTAAPAMVVVRVETDPTGAEVILDGRALAASTPVDVEVVGDGAVHELVLRRAGCEDKRKEIKGAAQALRLDLECAAPPPERKKPPRGKSKGTGAASGDKGKGKATGDDTGAEGDNLMRPKWRK